MSTLDNRPPGATDPTLQDDLASTHNNIMAQFTTISNRLDLQGSTLAQHAQLLEGTKGSAASGATPPSQHGATSSVPATHHPPPHDYRDDLRNKFHRPKINFPRYDDNSDPLPWLNRCESFFRGTRTLAVEQVWMAPPLNVTTPWNANMASCRGHVSQSLLIFALGHRSARIPWAN
jgi:hypothetical protein